MRKERGVSTIDRQRVTAVKSMEALGYAFDGIAWNAPSDGAATCTAQSEADAMHSLLVLRADKLAGSTEGSDEETELKMIADTVSAYEARRWPDGVVPGGKG
jgi:hypothetical protein